MAAEQSAEQFRGQARLPGFAAPRRYDLSLTPDLDACTFSGSVAVSVDVSAPTRFLVLNAADLDVSPADVQLTPQGSDQVLSPVEVTNELKDEILIIRFNEVLPLGEGTLVIAFQGTLNDKMKGFYRSVYELNGEKKNMAVTQFEPADARRCFPCWDEPAFKAVFKITLEVPSETVALSNMPVVEEKVNGPTKTVYFQETPIMSTYLVAVIVGMFDYVEAFTSDGTSVRVYTQVGKTAQGKFALEVAVKTLILFKEYFAVPYPLPKMDMIAIPDFSAGAMENYGLVTYRETALLFDERHSAAANKQRVAVVVAHELAHQWFGNLVTMEWWTHLWLNEGFATWVSYLAADCFFPEWNVWIQFLEESTIGFRLDALAGSHPIEVDVNHVDEIDEIFDAISYRKGAAVIRMLQSYLGADIFQKSLAAYIKRYAYSNAKTEDLWAALEEGSGEPVNTLMHSWTKQQGYPVVSVKLKDGKLELEQTQFLSSGSAGVGQWVVPPSLPPSLPPQLPLSLASSPYVHAGRRRARPSQSRNAHARAVLSPGRCTSPMTTSSSGSVETSANSRPGSFSFANASFTDILGSSLPAGGSASGYRAMTPPSLPLLPSLMSPSSYFNMPAGMNLADFLDSPVLLTSSIFPSPTTGAFGSQRFNWRPEAPPASSAEQGVKEEQRQPYSDFSFQTAPASIEEPAQATTTTFQPSVPLAPQGEETYQQQQQQPWGYQQQPGGVDASANPASFSAPATSSEMAPSGGVYRQTHSPRRSSDDGYNWRKYGQKQVKGSENPRSYYKCTFPSCPTKKKVETSIEGQITEIVYKGTHNHAKPLNTRRGSGGGAAAAQVLQSGGDASEHSFGGMSGAPVSTPENSSASFGDDEIGASSPRAGNVGGDENDDDEPDSKRWRKDGDGEGINVAGNRTVREPRVVVQTMSDIDILDDGYRWRKYGQKVVKGNPNPRSYYKCTTVGCPVRKHVERASHDLRAVITTYEGKHNHDVPAARGSAALYRPAPRAAVDSAMSTSHQYMANQQPSAMTYQTTGAAAGTQQFAPRPDGFGSQNQGSFGFNGSFGFSSGFDNPTASYMSQHQQQQRQNDAMHASSAKEEPREDVFFQHSQY